MNSVQQRLKASTIKHIESEIKLFYITKAELDFFINQDSRKQLDMTRDNEKILAFQNRQIQSMNMIVNAIEEAYDQLTTDHRKVIKHRYWKNQKLTWEGIALELNMHRNTAQKYKSDFVELVAAKLGWT